MTSLYISISRIQSHHVTLHHFASHGTTHVRHSATQACDTPPGDTTQRWQSIKPILVKSRHIVSMQHICSIHSWHTCHIRIKCSSHTYTCCTHTWPHTRTIHIHAHHMHATHTHTHVADLWHDISSISRIGLCSGERSLCEPRCDCFSCVSRKQWSKLQVQCRALWWDLMLPVVLVISQWRGMLKSSSFSSSHLGLFIVVYVGDQRVCVCFRLLIWTASVVQAQDDDES